MNIQFGTMTKGILEDVPRSTRDAQFDIRRSGQVSEELAEIEMVPIKLVKTINKETEFDGKISFFCQIAESLKELWVRPRLCPRSNNVTFSFHPAPRAGHGSILWA